MAMESANELVNRHLSSGFIRPGLPAPGDLSASLTAFVYFSGGLSFSGAVAADDVTPFDREKAAFQRLLPDLKRSHWNKYVAIHNGEVAATGESDNEVARRFFRTHGDTNVYIGFVGDEPPAYQIKPTSR